MNIHRLFNNQESRLVFPENFAPKEHHFLSTPADNLCEYAGRVCFSEDTELLTKNGWVQINKLPKNMEVATFNRTTKKIEYQIPYDYIEKQYNDEMIGLECQHLSKLTTKDHEWYVCIDNEWQLKKASDLIGQKGLLRRSAFYSGEKNKGFKTPPHKYTQIIHTKNGPKQSKERIGPFFIVKPNKMLAFAELMGYYFAEGCINGGTKGGKKNKKSGLRIVIFQHINSSKPIYNCINALGLKHHTFLDKRNNVNHIHIYSCPLARFLKKYGTLSENKKIPREFLMWPINLRKKMLNAMMYGDGGCQYNKYRIYSTNSEQLADDMQELITKSDKIASINQVGDQYIIREMANRFSVFNNPSTPIISKEKSHKKVYCVSVSNRILITRKDKCIIFSGNCYDSHNSNGKTRSTSEYFKHIHQVNHTSILSHYNFSVKFLEISDSLRMEILRQLANRPGCSFVEDDWEVAVTTNLRAANEWFKWNSEYGIKHFQGYIGDVIQNYAYKIAPLSMSLQPRDPCIYGKHSLANPTEPNEIWVSYLIQGVSRGLTHEQIRHNFQTAVSQRSTRYVDESESEWAWHPLLNKYNEQILDIRTSVMEKSHQYYGINPYALQPVAQEIYKQIVDTIESAMIKDGIDKFSARKSARGAARGFLGNALSTEMVFSSSLKGWRNIILQRSISGADPEIRKLSCMIYEDLYNQYPKYFSDLEKTACLDGIGYNLGIKNASERTSNNVY